MARVAVALTCTAEQRSELMALARSRTEEARLVERAKIVLACLEGKRNDAVGASLACGRIRWVCGGSALRQLGWPGCGIGHVRARPPNMARICACGFCANWNGRRPRGW